MFLTKCADEYEQASAIRTNTATPARRKEQSGSRSSRQPAQLTSEARPTRAESDIATLDAQAWRLMAAFTSAGYERIAPAEIQPAELFFDVVGESLRARTYVFCDHDGAELCLRPDLTVPTCRLHLDRRPDANSPARYCYSGSVFRSQPAGADRAHPREFRQTGIESFAAKDREQDDADVLALIVTTLCDAGLDSFQLRIGGLGLFKALIDALPMPERWRERLKRQFWRPEAFHATLTRLTSGVMPPTSLPPALLDRLDLADPPSAEAQILEHLAEAGCELIGTRTVAEIAQRLLAEIADRHEQPLPAQTARLIESYIAIEAPPRDVVDKVARLTRAHGIDISASLDSFERRLDLIEEAGVAIAEAEFSAEFGRNLEYYTDFVFEIISSALGPKSPIAGGGRYDNLLANVGAPREVPAVGASIHAERVLAVLRGNAP